MKEVELSEYAGETTQRSLIEAPSYELDRSNESSFQLPFNYASEYPKPPVKPSKKFKTSERKGNEVMMEQLLALQEQRYVEETTKILKSIANAKFMVVLSQVCFMYRIKPFLAATELNVKLRGFLMWAQCLKGTVDERSREGDRRIAMTLLGVYKRHMMKHFTSLKERTEALGESRIIVRTQVLKTPSPKVSRPISTVSAQTERPSRFFGSPATSTVSKLDDRTREEFRRTLKKRLPLGRDNRSIV